MKNLRNIITIKKSAFMILLWIVSMNAASSQTQDTVQTAPKKVNFIVLPMYDYRPVLEHSIAIFGKAIVTLDKEQQFISDILLSKSFNNPSYMGQLKNEFYFNGWRFALNATLMKQVNRMPSRSLGIDSDDLFGTELNMGYVQALAKRQFSPRFYGGFGLEWSFMGDYSMNFSEITDHDLKNTTLTYRMLQPIVTFEYDSRDNVVYPTSGFYITNQTNFISDTFGSTIERLGPELQPIENKDYFFAKNIMRATYYASLDGTWKSVLATRYGMRVGLGEVPVSMWENANNWVRGYKEGKYAGKQLHFFDMEWRKYVTNRLGFAVFGSAGFVGNSIDDTFSSSGFIPSGGAGLRLRLMKSKPVAFRFDYAVGKKGENSVYFALTEYF